MTQKQFFGLAGSSALLCGVLVWQAVSSVVREATWQTDRAARLHAVALEPGDDTQSAEKKGKRSVNSKKEEEVEYNKLTPNEAYVILRKGTERAFTGEYTEKKDPGTYICRRCNAALYNSEDKFESHCGWPSFDDEIKGSVKRRLETDGTGRIEIVCNNCGGHLGHVFLGESFTAKNTRHCVNSISMKFVAKGKPLPEVIKPKALKEREAKEKEAKEKAAKELEKEKAAGSATTKPEQPKPDQPKPE